MTQAVLAERVNIDITAIGKYESGERRPSVETAKKIADELGFDWTKFFEDNEEAPA
jgi:transcriptional regulator with XRE-family HTH domain